MEKNYADLWCIERGSKDVANIALRFKVLRRTQSFEVSTCIRMILWSRSAWASS